MKFTGHRAKGRACNPFVMASLGIALAAGILAVVVYVGSAITAPEVVGDSLQEAALKLHDAGIDVDIPDTEGTVTRQHPAGGEQVFRYQDFTLTYTDASGEHTIG